MDTKEDKIAIDKLAHAFYNLFTNAGGSDLNLENIHSLFMQGGRIVTKSASGEKTDDPASFIEPRRKILSDGTLTDFSEFEVSENTEIKGSLAQRSSVYQKKGMLNKKAYEGSGNKMFQFVKTAQGWRIHSVIWEDVS